MAASGYKNKHVDNMEKLPSQKPEGFSFDKRSLHSKYRPEYCQMLIDHMAGGLSWQCFCGVVGVACATTKLWLETHNEFAQAKAIGEGQSRLYWEKLGKLGSLGQIKDFNATIFIFTMKNRFNWSDRTDLKIDATVNDYKEEFSLLKSIPRAELLALVKKPENTNTMKKVN